MDFTNTNITILQMQICKYVSFPHYSRWDYRWRPDDDDQTMTIRRWRSDDDDDDQTRRSDDDDQTSQSDVLRKQLSIKHYAVRDPRRRRTENLEVSSRLAKSWIAHAYVKRRICFMIWLTCTDESSILYLSEQRSMRRVLSVIYEKCDKIRRKS